MISPVSEISRRSGPGCMYNIYSFDSCQPPVRPSSRVWGIRYRGDTTPLISDRKLIIDPDDDRSETKYLRRQIRKCSELPWRPTRMVEVRRLWNGVRVRHRTKRRQSLPLRYDSSLWRLDGTRKRDWASTPVGGTHRVRHIKVAGREG